MSSVPFVVVQSQSCVWLCDPHQLQHARCPCPSLFPRVCSNSWPLSQRSHPTTSSSVAPFSFCLQTFPASGSFLMSQLFASDGQSIGLLASTSVLPMNIQDWTPLELTWSLCYSGDSQESCPAPQFKSINSSALSFLYGPAHICTFEQLKIPLEKWDIAASLSRAHWISPSEMGHETWIWIL